MSYAEFFPFVGLLCGLFCFVHGVLERKLSWAVYGVVIAFINAGVLISAAGDAVA